MKGQPIYGAMQRPLRNPFWLANFSPQILAFKTHKQLSPQFNNKTTFDRKVSTSDAGRGSFWIVSLFNINKYKIEH